MSSEVVPPPRLAVAPDVRAHLAAWQSMAHAELLATLPKGQPDDFLYAPMQVLPQRSGKGLRPALCLAACDAFGGTPERALPFGVALEMMHLAFLVHDDIQDGSLFRRGGPALHHLLGMPLALNVGDAYAATSTAMLARAARTIDAAPARAVLDRWDVAMRETLEGQALDLGWQRDGPIGVTVEQYVTMAGKKTAWYSTILPLGMGAVVGAGDPAALDRLFAFGATLGLMFQIANDLSGLHAAPGEGDLEEGKCTVLVVQLLERLPAAERDAVVGLLRAPRADRGPEQVAWIVELMHGHGVIDTTQEVLCALAALCLSEADRAIEPLPSSAGRDVLLAMTAHLLEEDGHLALMDRPAPV